MKQNKSFFRLTEPTSVWFDGHILGNGDAGAVVWGDPSEFRIGFSKSDILWYSPKLHEEGWEKTYPELTEFIRKGDHDFLTRYGTQIRRSAPYACGTVSVILIRDDYRPLFVQELIPERGECSIHAAMPEVYRRTLGRIPHPEVDLKIRMLAGRNVSEILLDAPENCKAFIRFSPGFFELENMGKQAFSDQLFTQELPAGVSYSMAFSGIDFQRIPSGFEGELSFGGEKGAKRISVSIAASAEEAKKLLKYDEEAENRIHLDFWKKEMGKSSISIQEKDLADAWRFGVYALRASTKPGKLPPHLQGIWNASRYAAWNGDYHFNANLQECLWPCGTVNHPELLESTVHALLFDWREEFRKNARIAGLRGLMLPLCCDPGGRALCWSLLSMAMSMTAWMSLTLIEFLEYDRKWEKEIIAFLEEACDFQLSVLEKDEKGILHVPLSNSPEQEEFRKDSSHWHTLGRDPAIDLAAARILFTEYIRLAPEKNEIRSKAADALEHLAPLPVIDGALADYSIGFFENGNAPGKFPWSHRHPSRLFAVYPGSRFLPGLCPEDLAERSLKEFLSYGMHHFVSFTYAWLAILHARLGKGRKAVELLRILFREFMLKGGLMTHGARDPRFGMQVLELFQLEVTGGTTAGVTELLFQKSGEKIRLFPAYPSKNASFRSFNAGNGVCISAEKKQGKIVFIQLDFSSTGSLNIAPSCGFPGMEFHGEAGKSYQIRKKGRNWYTTEKYAETFLTTGNQQART